MNVYLVMYHIQYEGSDFVGVFSNLKAARKFVNKNFAVEPWSKWTDDGMFTKDRFGTYTIEKVAVGE